jgi:hypothetical protein
VIITSNRDESVTRSLALAPKFELVNGRNLLFPKDPQSGGSWFVINDYGHTFVLLNGAEIKHVSNPPYKKSRGVILLELASAIHSGKFWESIDLSQIEPFTVVKYAENTLEQLRWNGTTKNRKTLDKSVPHIWSSSTLYESEVVVKRKLWFHEFICRKKNSPLDTSDLMWFHTQTEKFNSENGVVINRNGKMLTKSVTQVAVESTRFQLTHLDLLKDFKTTLSQKIQ